MQKRDGEEDRGAGETTGRQREVRLEEHMCMIKRLVGGRKRWQDRPGEEEGEGAEEEGRGKLGTN